MGLFNRKKKEEEEAKQAAELKESQAKAEAARLQRAKEAAEKEAAEAKAEAEALKKQAEADAKKEALLDAQEKAEELRAKRAADEKARKDAIAAATIKHVWTNDDTYASLAFKYYGSIKKPFYMLIYEHNKHIIGDNMNSIKTGTEIEIPPLPKELEDQK